MFVYGIQQMAQGRLDRFNFVLGRKFLIHAAGGTPVDAEECFHLTFDPVPTQLVCLLELFQSPKRH